MLKFANSRNVAVLENDMAVLKKEECLRIAGVYTDYIILETMVLLFKGYQEENGSFTISDKEGIRVYIGNYEHTPDAFTFLISPKVGEDTRWIGDFRLRDLEEYIVTSGILGDLEIDAIVPQREDAVEEKIKIVDGKIEVSKE